MIEKIKRSLYSHGIPYYFDSEYATKTRIYVDSSEGVCYDYFEVVDMATGKSSVNVKIDTGVKTLATQLLERMGLDQTTAIDMFYRQIITERRLPFQPAVTLSLDEQIVAAALKRNPRRVTLPTDENGNVIIDKEKHPDIYEWAANG